MGRTTSTTGGATLVFDGDCAFCSRAVQWLTATLPAPPKCIPYQSANLDDLGLTEQEAQSRVWLVIMVESANDLPVAGNPVLMHQYGGYLAVSRMLRHQRSVGWRFLGFLIDTPPFSMIAGACYWLVARFRSLLPGGTPACNPGSAP